MIFLDRKLLLQFSPKSLNHFVSSSSHCVLFLCSFQWYIICEFSSYENTITIFEFWARRSSGVTVAIWEFLNLAQLTVSNVLELQSIKDDQVKKNLLVEYKDVFKEPTTLPPQRAYDNTVPLKPDNESINMRPY
jgi:hypothetical protein